MTSLNQVNLIGRLGRDPVYRATPSGRGQTTLSVATHHQWKDSAGALRTETDWVRVLLEGRLADTGREYLSKGRLIFVSGRLRTRRYQKDGATHFITEVVARELQMLDQRPPEKEELSDEAKDWVAAMDAHEAASPTGEGD